MTTIAFSPFLEGVTVKTNTGKPVKQNEFTFVSPLELWTGDWEFEDAFS